MMANKTAIEWTDATWTPIRARFESPNAPARTGWHCEHVSEACRNCFAESFNLRLGTGRDFKPAERKTVSIFLDEKMLLAPLKWKKPRHIFVCSMTDLFADFVEDAWIDKIFAVMALCPQHIFQVLTKRPARMRDYIQGHKSHIPYLGKMPLERVHLEASAHMDGDGGIYDTLKKIGNIYGLYLSSDWPLRNVWLGTSVEDQATADERIPLLLDTPAAIRFLSCEPLLGPVNLSQIYCGRDIIKPLAGVTWYPTPPDWPTRSITARHSQQLHWIIAGGESGPPARPSHPDWIRALRDQCAGAAVPFFFKQWGEWHPCEWSADGPWYPMAGAAEFDSWQAPVFDQADHDGWNWRRIGKHRAGNHLDGRQHMEFPE